MKTLNQIKITIIETICQYRISTLFLLIFEQKIHTFVANITYIFTDPTVGKFFTHSYQNPKSA